MAKKNWNRLKQASAVVALGVTGCGLGQTAERQASPTAEAAGPKPGNAHPASPGNVDRAAVDASIQDSLDRLQALNLFSVGRLVMNLPANATECYGVPCAADAAGWDAFYAEKARQAPRLAKLADQAAACNSGSCYVFTPSSPDEAVTALNALKIVEVYSLIQAQAQNNPSCYNLPCASDKAAADAENQRRAVEAFTIASYAKDEDL